MTIVLRVAPLALLLLPSLSQAQTGAGSAVGLEIPAPAPPRHGHFLTGTYVVGNYSPLPTSAGYGYNVQPYLRYQLASSPSGRLRPYLQYSFTSYRMASYATGPLYGPEGAGLPATPGFAPLALRSTPYGPGSYGYGGLGAFSVGIPMQLGRSSALLNIGGEILTGLLMPATWQGNGLGRP